MLALNAKWQRLLAADEIVAVSLVALTNVRQAGNNRTLEYYWTDADGDVTVSGNTYLRHNPIHSLVRPRTDGGDVQDEAVIRLVEGDGHTALSRIVDDRFLGMKLALDVCLLDEDDGTLTTPLGGYKGSCIGAGVEAGEEGPVFVLTFAGPLRKRGEAFPLTTSHHNQQTRDATDTALAYAHAVRDIKWARK